LDGCDAQPNENHDTHLKQYFSDLTIPYSNEIRHDLDNRLDAQRTQRTQGTELTRAELKRAELKTRTQDKNSGEELKRRNRNHSTTEKTMRREEC
jgi:hypothetical protein